MTIDNDDNVIALINENYHLRRILLDIDEKIGHFNVEVPEDMPLLGLIAEVAKIVRDALAYDGHVKKLDE